MDDIFQIPALPGTRKEAHMMLKIDITYCAV